MAGGGRGYCAKHIALRGNTYACHVGGVQGEVRVWSYAAEGVGGVRGAGEYRRA